jgi:Flp pilus assembly protein TadG
MNKNIESFVRRAHRDQSGQMIWWVAGMMLLLFAFASVVIDLGRLYYIHRLLQNATDAAALAGAQALPSSTAVTLAESYGSGSGGKNVYANLPSPVTVVATGTCMTSTFVDLPCLNSSGAISSSGYNGIVVQQTVTVPLMFAALVGVKPITITATATAAMRGSARAPYNVAIVVDSTRSMQDPDTDGLGCTSTKEACALQGVQTLLGEQGLSPCTPGLSSCGSATPVDEVSLFTFPAVSSVSPEYCGGGSVSVQPYPLPAASSYTPLSSPLYQVVSFLNDYRTSDGSSTLSTSSNLVKAAGGGSCAGLQDPGGEGTYYPGAIYTAASLLLTNQANRGSVNGVPTTQNAMIILGDGDANTTTTGGPGGNPQLASTASKTATTYPSYVDQCQQAVQAANWATSQGITVYSVAYDAGSSGTCKYDTSNSPPINEAGITACATMEQLASTPSKFYTSNSSCTLTGGNTVESLNAIFTAIAGNFSYARLVPNGTT